MAATATSTVQEESKGEEVSAIKSLNMEELLAKGVEKVNQLPWRAHLTNPESVLSKGMSADVEN